MKKLLLTCCLIAVTIAKAQVEPQLNWAKGMGGTESDISTAITIGTSNVYTTGHFRGTADFDPGTGKVNLTAAGENDIFISKLNAITGNIVWARSIGGNSYDAGTSVAVDASGNVYITGLFNNTVDFDPGAGTYNLTADSIEDAFIAKLDASGNFVWAKKIGAKGLDGGSSISLDLAGNLYVLGNFNGKVDFDPGVNTFNLTSAGDDIFVTKFNVSGNFKWAKSFGGNDYDVGQSIKADASGNLYLTGYFNETVDFDPGTATFNLTSAGYSDIFISRLDSVGKFVWAKRIGANSNDYGNSISLDLDGNVYTTGSFNGSPDFDPGNGVFQLSSSGSADIFISKLDASGNFVWAKKIGGTGYDAAYSLYVSKSGYVFFTGIFTGTADFDPGTGIMNLVASNSFGSAFIAKLDTAGNFGPAFNTWAAAGIGGSSIIVDAVNYVYATGGFSGTNDFDPSSGIFNLTSAGASDISVAAIKQVASSGIEEFIGDKVTIYPNPTHGIINLELGMRNESNLQIQVLNSLGQVVMEETQIQHSQFNIQHLPDGLYFVKVMSKNTIIASQKIIKN